MSLYSLVLARYQILAKDTLAEDLLELQKFLDRGDLIAFSDKEKVDLPLTAYPAALMGSEQLKYGATNMNFAHIVKRKSTKLVNFDKIKTDEAALKMLHDAGYEQMTMEDFREVQAVLGKRNYIKHPGTVAFWLMTYDTGTLQLNKTFIELSDREKAKSFKDAGIDCYVLKKEMVFLVPSAFAVKKSFAFQSEAQELSAEEKKLLKDYFPDLGAPSPFHVEMSVAEFKKRVGEMSQDDVAWHFLHSPHAFDLQSIQKVQELLSGRERNLLMIMNKSLTKKERTDLASWFLSKMGATFAGGPTLKKFIKTLAKSGELGKEILEEEEEDEIGEEIQNGKITDPDKLRELDISKYSHELADSPHTPADVLEKIVEERKKDKRGRGGTPPELSRNGNMQGGLAGYDYTYHFCDALRNQNYPIDKLVKYFDYFWERYEEDNPKSLLHSLAMTLWTRPDLPIEKAEDLVKIYGHDSATPPYAFDEKHFLEYWKHVNLKKHAEYSLSNVINHPNVPVSVLKQLLELKTKDEDKHLKEAAYRKLREIGGLSDEDVADRVRKKLHFDGPTELLKNFGALSYLNVKSNGKLSFQKVPDDQLEKIKKEMDAATTHDDFAFEVLEAYTVDQKIHKDYDKTAEEIGNVKHNLYHGTSLTNAAGILASGINVSAEARTGQMFGSGFYLASSASKAAQYASDNFSKTGLGVVFRMDVALGKVAKWKYGRPIADYIGNIDDKKVQKQLEKKAKEQGVRDLPRWHLDYDSVHAQKGMALLADEYVVKNGQQININEIIIIRKEAKE